MPTIHVINVDGCGITTTPAFSLIFNNNNLNVNIRRPLFYGCIFNINCGGFTDCVFNSSSDFVNYIQTNPITVSYCDPNCIDTSMDRAFQIDLIRVDTGSEMLVLSGIGYINVLKGASFGTIQYLDFSQLQHANGNFTYQLRINDFCPGQSGLNGYSSTFQMLHL